MPLMIHFLSSWTAYKTQPTYWYLAHFLTYIGLGPLLYHDGFYIYVPLFFWLGCTVYCWAHPFLWVLSNLRLPLFPFCVCPLWVNHSNQREELVGGFLDRLFVEVVNWRFVTEPRAIIGIKFSTTHLFSFQQHIFQYDNITLK